MISGIKLNYILKYLYVTINIIGNFDVPGFIVKKNGLRLEKQRLVGLQLICTDILSETQELITIRTCHGTWQNVILVTEFLDIGTRFVQYYAGEYRSLY